MIKKVKDLLSKNLWEIVKFEIVFKIITLLIASPLFLNIFKLTMKVTGFNYLTIENIGSFILNPLTIVLLFILILLVGFYAVFDIGTIIVLLDASNQNKKIGYKDAMYISLQKSIRVFKFKNFGLLLFMLFIIPFLNLGISSSILSTIKIPEFIMDFIVNNSLLNTLYFGLVIVLFIIFLKWFYSLHYYFLEDKSFKDAVKESKNLSKNHHFKDMVSMLFVQLLVLILYFGFIILGLVLIVLFNNVFSHLEIVQSILISVIVGFILLSLILFAIIGTSFSYACISVLFYSHKEQKKEKITHINIKEAGKKVTKSKWKIIKYICILLAFIGLTTFNYGVIKGNYNLNIEYVKNMKITAHRGASIDYPENTMIAFIEAKKLGADWIELDVQQTKDQQIIVSHDTNFKRVTGVDMNAFEATYEEIKELDAGSFKDKKFKGEKIPLLEDVIKWAKENNVKLNIELKPTGHETEFESQVIEIIKKNNFENDCVITSQVYSVLENAKKVDKNIKTVYVMSIAIGDILSLDKADSFSLEASNINNDMVSKIHREEKEVYGWTVNTEEGINKMINLNVDNIITDNILLGKKLVAKSKSSDLITEIIKLIQSLFG